MTTPRDPYAPPPAASRATAPRRANQWPPPSPIEPVAVPGSRAHPPVQPYHPLARETGVPTAVDMAVDLAVDMGANMPAVSAPAGAPQRAQGMALPSPREPDHGTRADRASSDPLGARRPDALLPPLPAAADISSSAAADVSARATLLRLVPQAAVLSALAASQADYDEWVRSGAGWPLYLRPDGHPLADAADVLAALRVIGRPA